MDISMQYRMYELVTKLTEQGFQTITGDDERDEIWLMKKAGRKSDIIRVKSQSFDWFNQLRQDSLAAYQQMQQIRQSIVSTNAEFYSIYIAKEQPVDEWGKIKHQPFGQGNRKSPRMHVYYLNQGDEENEISRLNQDLNVSLPAGGRDLGDMEIEAAAIQMKKALFQKIQEEQEKRKKIFSFSTPLFTYILIAINVIVFILQITTGDLQNTQHLINMGANFNLLVMEGEWWRFFSSMFLHLDFIHILMNMIALYFLGTAIERIFGRTRFLLIYFLGGLTGSIASFAFSINVSVGASGAIFALFGALLLFGLIYKQIFFQTMGHSIIVILAINLVVGFTDPQIDMGAHIGGLVGGFLMTTAMYVPRRKNQKYQILGFLGWIILSIGLLLFGWSYNTSSVEFKIEEIQSQVEEGEFREAISLATETLDETDDANLIPLLLFHRSYAYIQQLQFDKAREDLEDALQYEEVFPEIYYNLAIIYSQQGVGMEKLEAIIDEGLDQFPDNEDLLDLKDDLQSY
ncbi:rhomboid family intramembrane serine protease [Oceanobacillus sp. J11TS1]|uniref:rhomboid family intramembrane serine protease n=1 Tax=Oceanobacillus sp. J11TS1 TaxID=2807191 RepID=UPI001B00D989|nr:rhomboid family intramembrane serine protease [Oceanobacillus sp. J11TS1]GIO23133.1 rhomboid protease GluP [Oceanobacillus sp. J11TS1]